MDIGYVSLGEARTVKLLIEERSKLDSSFYPKMTVSDAYTSSGVPRFSEEILCIYASLDKLILECGLSEREELVVQQLMLGYQLSDIADHYGLQKSTCSTLLSRALSKITRYHDETWAETMKGIMDRYDR